MTLVNRPVARSLLAAVASTAGSCQAGSGSLKMMLVGFADDCGKYLASRAVPLAESVPDGAVVVPPNPLALYPMEVSASRPKNTTPIASVGTGWRTTRAATRPQTPLPPLDWMLHGISFSRPNIRANTRFLTSMKASRNDSSAGSRVSAAISMTAIPIASGMPSSE